MIHETPFGFFARAPGDLYPRGPFRSRRQAEQALANAAAKAERAANPKGKLVKVEPIEARVVKAARPSQRPKRRTDAIKARHEQRVAKRRAKLGRVKRADAGAKVATSSSPAQGGDDA